MRRLLLVVGLVGLSLLPGAAAQSSDITATLDPARTTVPVGEHFPVQAVIRNDGATRRTPCWPTWMSSACSARSTSIPRTGPTVGPARCRRSRPARAPRCSGRSGPSTPAGSTSTSSCYRCSGPARVARRQLPDLRHRDGPPNAGPWRLAGCGARRTGPGGSRRAGVPPAPASSGSTLTRSRGAPCRPATSCSTPVAGETAPPQRAAPGSGVQGCPGCTPAGQHRHRRAG